MLFRPQAKNDISAAATEKLCGGSRFFLPYRLCNNALLDKPK